MIQQTDYIFRVRGKIRPDQKMDVTCSVVHECCSGNNLVSDVMSTYVGKAGDITSANDTGKLTQYEGYLYHFREAMPSDSGFIHLRLMSAASVISLGGLLRSDRCEKHGET